MWFLSPMSSTHQYITLPWIVEVQSFREQPARICTAAAHGRNAARPPAAQFEHTPRAARSWNVETPTRSGRCKTRPGLDHRIDVERANILSEFYKRNRGGID